MKTTTFWGPLSPQKPNTMAFWGPLPPHKPNTAPFWGPLSFLTQVCPRNLIQSKSPTLMFLKPTNKAHFPEASVSPFQVKKLNCDDFEDLDNQANILNEFAKKSISIYWTLLEIFQPLICNFLRHLLLFQVLCLSLLCCLVPKYHLNFV